MEIELNYKVSLQPRTTTLVYRPVAIRQSVQIRIEIKEVNVGCYRLSVRRRHARSYNETTNLNGFVLGFSI